MILVLDSSDKEKKEIPFFYSTYVERFEYLAKKSLGRNIRGNILKFGVITE